MSRRGRFRLLGILPPDIDQLVVQLLVRMGVQNYGRLGLTLANYLEALEIRGFHCFLDLIAGPVALPMDRRPVDSSTLQLGFEDATGDRLVGETGPLPA